MGGGGSAAVTSATVASPFSQRTSIRRSSASVSVLERRRAISAAQARSPTGEEPPRNQGIGKADPAARGGRKLGVHGLWIARHGFLLGTTTNDLVAAYLARKSLSTNYLGLKEPTSKTAVRRHCGNAGSRCQ